VQLFPKRLILLCARNELRLSQDVMISPLKGCEDDGVSTVLADGRHSRYLTEQHIRATKQRRATRRKQVSQRVRGWSEQVRSVVPGPIIWVTILKENEVSCTEQVLGSITTNFWIPATDRHSFAFAGCDRQIQWLWCCVRG